MAERYIKFIYNKTNRRIAAATLIGGLLVKNSLKHIWPADFFFPFYGFPSKDSSLFGAVKLLNKCRKDMTESGMAPVPVTLPFISRTTEVISAGFSAFKLDQSRIGFPQTYFCDTVEEVSHLNIAMGNSSRFGRKNSVVFDKLDETEIKLMENMLLSENAKLFSVARHISYIKRNWAIYQALIPSIFTVFGYFMAFHSPRFLFAMSKNPISLVHIMLVSVSGVFISYILCKITKAALARRICRQADEDASRISDAYMQGGIEMYDKQSEINKCLRMLLGKRGEKRFNEDGNVIGNILFNPQPNYTERKRHLEDSLEDGNYIIILNSMSSNTPGTFLSPYVHYMICEVFTRDKKNSTRFNGDLITSPEELFKTMGDMLKENDLQSREDYVSAVLAILPIAEYVHEIRTSGQSRAFHLRPHLHEWLSSYSTFAEKISLSSNPGQIMLFVLKLTSALERALGDVYVLSGKPCPFLLRDLISTKELESKFGKTMMKLLKICMGSPLGLNLRNLAWHGFLLPKEIPNVFISLLLFICEGISSYLPLKSISQRPILRECAALKKLETYFSNLDVKVFRNGYADFLLRSDFISPGMMTYFDEAVSCYEVEKYGECVIMLLPFLENTLRTAFANCNNCGHRVLTAECSTLYTTMDEVLAECIEGSKENKIRQVLGDKLMVLLIDLFSMLAGPRLRDKISHSEMALEVLDQSSADLLLCIIFSVASSQKKNEAKFEFNIDKLSFNDASSTSESSEFSRNQNAGDERLNNIDEVLTKFERKLHDYESRFHPLSIAKQNCFVCVDKMASLRKLKAPVEFMNEKTELGELERKTITIPHYRCCSLSVEIEIRNLLSEKSRTLYRGDKKEMEIVLILSKIAKECSAAVQNMIDINEERLQSYETRNLRSRQRTNYKTMIIRLPEVCRLCWDILQMVSGCLLLFQRDENILNMKSYSIRRWKSELKRAENLRTLTSKNKWDEASCLKYPE